MKTAVEWYDTQLKELDYKLQSGLINWTQCKSLMVEAREQALEMEKDQKIKMLKTFLHNIQTGEDVEDVEGWFEQYESFKQQEQ
jgi:hypothetical protein